MNLMNATKALAAYLDADIPVFLWGAPGVGKSDTVRQIANDRDIPMIDFRAILRDPVDLRGLPSVNGDTAKWLAPDDLPRADRDGEEGIFFMDELNAAPASVQAACFGLVLDRKVGEYRLPEGWRIIAAGNRQADRAAAQRMPTALANRFAHIDIEPDVESFSAWAFKNNVDPMVVAFVRFRSGLLHNMEGNDLRAFPTPRAWSQVAKIANAPEALRLSLVTGLVGEGAAAEFEGFVRVYKDLPSLDLVLANPTGAPLVKDPAAKYAISAGLARKVDRKTFGAAMAYTSRISREFNIMMVIDAVRRDPGLSHTQAFTTWATENQDVTLN
ncbi:AAA family ATPase [Aurantimonas sp. DM33-3]|uniref:AAA family ATPase n=1 Tax=Aurantimonas sp. DM33-3 TaxID=2766955 RepID=UPI001652AD34|nr:MoxR family ATPase [Aurantimonas sp. DM33-3]MBC6714762.1 AAA family ATPase [Aurantimonas sp. DM33-3]